MGAPDAGVGVELAVGVEVAVGVGVFGFGAIGLLALAEPPMMLSINASTSTAVRIINRPFCFLMGIFLSVTFLQATAYTKTFRQLTCFYLHEIDPKHRL